MKLFDFSGNSLNGTVFGTDGAANAKFRNDFGFFPQTLDGVHDGFGGANCGA